MSKYTTEVRYICETSAGLTESEGYSRVDDILEKSVDKVFDFSYPIFDENYRRILEKKILKHYYVREICAETVGLWKLFLASRMNEIMPYYNKLYATETLNFNPLYDVDLTIDHTLDNQKNGTEHTVDSVGGSVRDVGESRVVIDSTTVRDVDTGNTSRDKFSDTPQGALTGVENDTYLTTARKITDSGTVDETDDLDRTDTTNSENTRIYNTDNTTDGRNALSTTEDYIEHVRGKRGTLSYSKMLQDYRDTLLNIDMMIINDLKDLFFGLW